MVNLNQLKPSLSNHPVDHECPRRWQWYWRSEFRSCRSCRVTLWGGRDAQKYIVEVISPRRARNPYAASLALPARRAMLCRGFAGIVTIGKHNDVPHLGWE